jgi:hypothetical protein
MQLMAIMDTKRHGHHGYKEEQWYNLKRLDWGKVRGSD